MADPRRVVALLANDDMRRAFAEVVLAVEPAADLSPSRRRRVLNALEQAGLIERDDGGFRAGGGVFRELLASFPAIPVATGVERFLRDGAIDTYPANQAERRELLEWVVGRAIRPGEVLDEREIGERLRPFHEDVAVLRRYLVDAGLLERTRSGTAYALPESPEGAESR